MVWPNGLLCQVMFLCSRKMVSLRLIFFFDVLPALVLFCFPNIWLHRDPNQAGHTMYSAEILPQIWYGEENFIGHWSKYLQCGKTIWTFQTEFFANVRFYVVFLTNGLDRQQKWYFWRAKPERVRQANHLTSAGSQAPLLASVVFTI